MREQQPPLYITGICFPIPLPVCTLIAASNALMQRHTGTEADPLKVAHELVTFQAAAVADHFEVAHLQLTALKAVGREATAELVAASNRYGQSALHIAARKGSLRLIRLLLGASGGPSALRSTDCAGKTPMDVATKNCHLVAIQEFSRA